MIKDDAWLMTPQHIPGASIMDEDWDRVRSIIKRRVKGASQFVVMFCPELRQSKLACALTGALTGRVPLFKGCLLALLS